MSARDSGAARLFELAAQRQRMCEGVNQAIAAVLNHGQFILGPEVARLEKRLADFCKAEHCIGCASGTDALQLVLMAEGIGPGDAVFVPAFTFVASAGAVVLAGATPIFIDISRDNFTIETSSLEAAILDAKRHDLVPRAVIAVDLFGQPADYPALRRIAEWHGLTLIADAAQSFGASLHGEPVGTLAAFTATSFYPTKPLGGMGDGGAIFTNSGPAAELLRSLRAHGHDDRRESIRIGLNSRLDTLQATILLEKLERFPQEILARGAVAKRYSEGLKELVQTPIVEAGSTSVWAQYTIVSEHRDEIAIACREAGVPTQIFYPRPLHFEAAYRGYPKTPSGLPNCEWLAQRVISLPMNAYLTDEAVDLVVLTVRSALSTA